MRSHQSVSTKKRNKEEAKITEILYNTDYLISEAIFEYGDFNQCLDSAKEVFDCYAYDFKILGVKSVQLNIEPYFESYLKLTPNLINSK